MKFYFHYSSSTSFLFDMDRAAVWMLFCSWTRNKFHQVSWIRRRDLAILTSNTSVYTTDTRFNVIHIPTSNNWDLRIKPVEERDSGVFECQVNTDPKINFPIHLHVTSKLTTISRIYVLHIVLRFLSDMLFWVISPQNLQVQCSKHLSSPHHTEPKWWLYDVILITFLSTCMYKPFKNVMMLKCYTCLIVIFCKRLNVKRDEDFVFCGAARLAHWVEGNQRWGLLGLRLELREIWETLWTSNFSILKHEKGRKNNFHRKSHTWLPMFE